MSTTTEPLVTGKDLFQVPVLAPAARRGLVSGGTFALDIPPGVPAVWGEGERVLWAEGEGLMVAGPQGVGKTTLTLQLACGLAGLSGFETLLDLPVKPLPAGRRVLYLALDRPRQIARALRRIVEPEDRARLDERILVWAGPLDFDVVKEPLALARWAVEIGVGAVVVDSLKDVVDALSDEQAASNFNSAMQECLAEGIEFLILHHPRKANADNKRPSKLDDVHGSGNLTRGLGSIVYLYGEAGETLVEFLHLKQPAETVRGFLVMHDHAAGRSTAFGFSAGLSGRDPKTKRQRRIAELALAAGSTGIGLEDVERECGVTDRTARKDLAALVEAGALTECERNLGGRDGKFKRWHHVPPLTK
jgi:replicative DNA helicase